MPKSLTLATKLVPIRETKDLSGWTVPWEVNGYAEDFEASRHGGVFDLSAWGTLHLSGPDAADFLQRMSTISFKNFDRATATPGGFLTGRAGVIALGWFLAGRDGGFDFVLAPHLVDRAKAHIEMFHFAEKLKLEDRSSEWAVFGLWAPTELTQNALGLEKNRAALRLQTISAEGIEFQAWRDDCREALVWVRMKREAAGEWLEWLRSLGVSLLGHRLFEFQRLSAGLAEAGVEVGEKDILLEASAERSVSRNKGCYPGQEVIERIFTYGQVNRKILTLTWRGEPPVGTLPITLKAGEQDAASLVAWERDPADTTRGVGLAYVRKAHWDFAGELTFDGFAARLRH